MSKTFKYILIGIGAFMLLCFLIDVLDGEYVSKLESIVLAVTTGLVVYSIADDSKALQSLQEEYDRKKESDRVTILNLQEQNRYLQDKLSSYEEEKRQAFRRNIYSEIVRHLDLFDGYSAEDLTEIFMRNLSYVKINSVDDIVSDEFPKKIKTAICGELGLLDLYQNAFGTPGRMSVDGSFVKLSDEEYAKLTNEDYGFIVDEIKEFPRVEFENP